MTRLLNFLPEGFVNLQEIVTSLEVCPRYATRFNFTGRVVKGYKASKVIVTIQAAEALALVQEKALKIGMSLVVYDGYRPQKAVMDFVEWCSVPEILEQRKMYYPFLTKADLFADGYISEISGHTRGSAVDLTLKPLGNRLLSPDHWAVQSLVLKDGRQIQVQEDGTLSMGGHFDLFDQVTHTESDLIDKEIASNRKLLSDLMTDSGFRPYAKEWWHFHLENEPFPEKIFNFDIE